MTYYDYYTYILIHKYKVFGIVSYLTFLSFGVYAQNTQDIQLANEYVLKGEKQKALSLYEELAKNDNNIPSIHNNYFNVLLDLNKYDEAKDYLKKILIKERSKISFIPQFR